MVSRSCNPTAIDAEVNLVRTLGIDALRARWRIMFAAAPPAGLSKDILARMVTYRLQEQAWGGLDREAVKLLVRLARGEQAAGLARHIKTGTVLVREYNGERHTVTIVPNGFVWQGATYASLSMIARVITGTAWNGPRFFGLRMQERKNSEGGRKPPARPSPSRRTKARRDIDGAGIEANQVRSDG